MDIAAKVFIKNDVQASILYVIVRMYKYVCMLGAENKVCRFQFLLTLLL